jgi:hypothetical protein
VVNFRTFAGEWLAFTAAAVAAVIAGTLAIQYPHAILVFKTGPWLYAFGILVAFAVYGGVDALISAVLQRGDGVDASEPHPACLLKVADYMVRYCPGHGSEEEYRDECVCELAEEIRERAAELADAPDPMPFRPIEGHGH